MLKGRLEENAGRRLSCRLIPNSLIRTSIVQVSEVSNDVFVDLAFKRLQVIFRQEHRAGKKIPFHGCSCYEAALRGNSACTTEVHSIGVPSFAIPQRTADLSRPWHYLSNAVSTVTVYTNIKMEKRRVS